MNLLFVILAVVILGASLYPRNSSAGPAPALHQYGQIIDFSDRREIIFPDFSVRYVDEKKIPYGNGKLSMRMYRFELKTSETISEITWSAGTGDIGPTIFSAGSKQFALELKMSELLNTQLKANQMVLSPYTQ